MRNNVLHDFEIFSIFIEKSTGVEASDTAESSFSKISRQICSAFSALCFVSFSVSDRGLNWFCWVRQVVI